MLLWGLFGLVVKVAANCLSLLWVQISSVKKTESFEIQFNDNFVFVSVLFCLRGWGEWKGDVYFNIQGV
jgi:hypothetical protein